MIKAETINCFASQEPDPTTNARAVPIYATTVILDLSKESFIESSTLKKLSRAMYSMTVRMEPASSGSRSLGISTVVS